MKSIIEFLLTKSKIITLILIFIFIMGFVSILNLKKYAFAPTDYGAAFITTILPGASPRDVELKITDKIEQKLQEVEGLKKVKSISMESFSYFEIEFDQNYDFDKIVLDMQKSIDRIDDFPANMKGDPNIQMITEDTRPIFEVALTGTADYDILRKYTRVLEQDFLTSKYIGSVQKAGYLKQEVKIIADQAKLRNRSVSIGEIAYAIAERNFRLSAGDLDQDKISKKYVIQSEFKNINEVKNVIIRSGFDGNRIVISDIAEVIKSYEKPDKFTRYKGKDAIHLILLQKSGADMIKTVKKVKRIFTDFKKTLPDTIQADIVIDHSTEVTELLKIVSINAYAGFFLVLITLFIFLDFRIAFWTAMGIPTSVFIAFILFPYFNLSIHYISLLAIILVLGMLVDDAIIIAENIYRYREQGLDPKTAATKGVQEVMWPVVTTVLTTIIVFLPILGMSGTMGQIFKSIPIVIILLLGASLLEGLFFLPIHIAHIKIIATNSRKNVIFSNIEKAYKKFITISMHNSWKTIFGFFLVLIMAFVILFTGIKFIWVDAKDGIIGSINFEVKVGTTLEETSKKVKYIETILNDFSTNEITGFITTIGEDKSSTANFGILTTAGSYLGNILIHFTPIEARERKAEEILQEIKDKILPGSPFEKISAEVLAQGPPTGRAVAVTIIHTDDEVRDRAENMLITYLQSISGVKNIEDNIGQGKQRIDITLDYDLIAQLGLTPSSVATTIRTAFNGIVVSKVIWQGEEVEFRIILNEASRKDALTINSLTIRNMRELTVMNKQGKLIPIGRLIKQNEVDDTLKIHHLNGDRSVTVWADIDKSVTTSKIVNKKIKEEFVPEAKKIAGLHVEFGGEEEAVLESVQDFFVAFVLAILGIYFILAVLFNSFTQPLLVMIVIPFALPGVVFAFFEV